MMTPNTPIPPQTDQTIFRIVLDTISRPGKQSSFHQSNRIKCARNLIIETLCDYDTSLFYQDRLVNSEVKDWIKYQVRTTVIENPKKADFICCDTDFANDLTLNTLLIGSLEMPHLSTTLIIQLDDSSILETNNLAMKGPGIPNEISIEIPGLSQNFWKQRIALQDDFPLGIDMFLCYESKFLAIPRSTQIELGA